MIKKSLLLGLFSFAILFASAKDYPESSVPNNVKSYVNKNYPKRSDTKWKYEDDKGYYQAKFEVDGKDHKVQIDKKGNVLYSKEDMDAQNIPSNIRDHIRKNYKGAEILGANKKRENGNLYYDVGIVFKNDHGNKRHRNIVFDVRGNVVKK